MKAANWPRRPLPTDKLLVLDAKTQAWVDRHAADLPDQLQPGDLLVVNDAATLPGSLHGHAVGQPIELRLHGQTAQGHWLGLLFGAGDWHQPTELRPPPPLLQPGDAVDFGALQATVVAVDGRVLTVAFAVGAAQFWQALHAVGHPVQYSYLQRALGLHEVQTGYAGPAVAAEMPSAGRILTAAMLARLHQRGIAVATLTHAAGLSSTGDAALDATLPWPERYTLPATTIAAIAKAKRVIAVGTTVVRALEDCQLRHGKLVAGAHLATLVLGPQTQLRVVHGVLSGMHDVDSSHFGLLTAFAPLALLRAATAHATQVGYLQHEFGDACLVWGR